MLSTWLSYGDLATLCIRATLADKTGSCVIWGASNNARSYWGSDSRDALAWLPTDSADTYAGQVGGIVSDNPVQERYQGGVYTTYDYSRKAPPAGKLFE